MWVQPTILAPFNGLSSAARFRNATMPGISAKHEQHNVSFTFFFISNGKREGEGKMFTSTKPYGLAVVILYFHMSYYKLISILFVLFSSPCSAISISRLPNACKSTFRTQKSLEPLLFFWTFSRGLTSSSSELLPVYEAANEGRTCNATIYFPPFIILSPPPPHIGR